MSGLIGVLWGEQVVEAVTVPKTQSRLANGFVESCLPMADDDGSSWLRYGRFLAARLDEKEPEFQDLPFVPPGDGHGRFLFGRHRPRTIAVGVNGAGGAGAWDTTTANWWNGTSNVPWNGGTAVFGGTGGVVTSFNFGPSATGLTFDSPGYSLQSGWLNAAGLFPITTNTPATIATTLDTSSSATMLVKRGAAPLTMSGTNFIDHVRVEEGEYLLAGSGSLFFSDVELADTPGVVVTLGQTFNSTSIGGLSGGGANGGHVRPSAAARTVTLSISGGGVFDGVMEDNGAGRMAVTFTGGSNAPQTLTRANTYTGATFVSVGTAIFSGNGSALSSSALQVGAVGTLRLDNSGMALSNRLPDAADLSLRSGRVELIGNAVTAVDEHLGPLQYAGASSISATQAGSATALLTFASVVRQAHATIDFSGTGRVGWTGLVNDAAGLAGPGFTFGNEWATAGADGRLEALSVYTPDLATAGATDHVKLTASSITLAASATAATVNWQNNTGIAGLMEIGTGQSLALTSGGVLSSGATANVIHGGTLLVGAPELVIANRNDVTVQSSIAETLSGTALTKTGAGTLTLTGTNNYSGVTAINQGILVVGSDAALGTGSTIEFNGGTLRASASFTSNKGVTRGSDWVATVDTGGFDVTLSGSANTSIFKVGAGSLRLPGATVASYSVVAGTLALPTMAGGMMNLRGGVLSVAGTLNSLSLEADSTLDLGGPNAVVLQTGQVRNFGSSIKLTIRTGIGATPETSDRWSIDSYGSPGSSFASSSVLFDFQDLGGAATGTAYTLLNLPYQFSTPPPSSTFALTPAAIAAGWRGTFSVSNDGVNNYVKVNFTSVPEPGVAHLVGFGLIAALSGRRRCWGRVSGR